MSQEQCPLCKNTDVAGGGRWNPDVSHGWFCWVCKGRWGDHAPAPPRSRYRRLLDRVAKWWGRKRKYFSKEARADRKAERAFEAALGTAPDDASMGSIKATRAKMRMGDDLDQTQHGALVQCCFTYLKA